MSDPVSERAHYLTVESGGSADLFLIQQGRLEGAAAVPVIWSRSEFAKAERPGSGTRPGSRLRRVIMRPLTTLFTVVV
jgi:hypothetical protein